MRIVIGGRYSYGGRDVIVDGGDRIEQLWDVTYVDTGIQVRGVCTSQLHGEQK